MLREGRRRRVGGGALWLGGGLLVLMIPLRSWVVYCGLKRRRWEGHLVVSFAPFAGCSVVNTCEERWIVLKRENANVRLACHEYDEFVVVIVVVEQMEAWK